MVRGPRNHNKIGRGENKRTDGAGIGTEENITSNKQAEEINENEVHAYVNKGMAQGARTHNKRGRVANKRNVGVAFGAGENVTSNQQAEKINENEVHADVNEANVDNEGMARGVRNHNKRGRGENKRNVGGAFEVEENVTSSQQAEEISEIEVHNDVNEANVDNEGAEEQCENQEAANEHVEVQIENENEGEAQFVNGRRVLRLENGLFVDSDAVSRVIRKNFETRVDPDGACWKKVSFEMKNFYFGEFKKAYYWDNDMDALVRSAWNTKAAKRYSDMLSEHRTAHRKPAFIPQNIWDEWGKYWQNDEFKRLSERNTKNRKGKDGFGPSCHTGGSISIAQHKRRLAKELGRDPTFPELFFRTHIRKVDGKSLVDAKAKAVHDRMTTIREQRSESSELIDENQIYLEAVGGKRSDRVYGLGAVGNAHCRKERFASNKASTSSAYTIKLENEVKELKQVVSDMNQHIEEQNQKMEERVRELVREMMANMGQSSQSVNSQFPPQS